MSLYVFASAALGDEEGQSALDLIVGYVLAPDDLLGELLAREESRRCGLSVEPASVSFMILPVDVSIIGVDVAYTPRCV